MKKILTIIFTLLFISAAGLVKAGTNTELSSPNNDKNQGKTTRVKANNKYSFTLFNFFTESLSNQKADSIKSTKKVVLKNEEGISSDL